MTRSSTSTTRTCTGSTRRGSRRSRRRSPSSTRCRSRARSRRKAAAAAAGPARHRARPPRRTGRSPCGRSCTRPSSTSMCPLLSRVLNSLEGLKRVQIFFLQNERREGCVICGEKFFRKSWDCTLAAKQMLGKFPLGILSVYFYMVRNIAKLFQAKKMTLDGPVFYRIFEKWCILVFSKTRWPRELFAWKDVFTAIFKNAKTIT